MVDRGKNPKQRERKTMNAELTTAQEQAIDDFYSGKTAKEKPTNRNYCEPAAEQEEEPQTLISAADPKTTKEATRKWNKEVEAANRLADKLLKGQQEAKEAAERVAQRKAAKEQSKPSAAETYSENKVKTLIKERIETLELSLF
jgi:hypothetical protein